MSRLISRDPFARSELHSERIYTGQATGREMAMYDGCNWCGGRKGTLEKPFLFKYWNESDSGRKSRIHGQFCSVSCMRMYHVS